jgi:hypothetical protein
MLSGRNNQFYLKNEKTEAQRAHVFCFAPNDGIRPESRF